MRYLIILCNKNKLLLKLKDEVIQGYVIETRNKCLKTYDSYLPHYVIKHVLSTDLKH